MTSTARADDVTDWNQHMLRATTIAGTSPLVATRVAAIVQASVFDAVNGIDGKYAPLHVAPGAPAGASRRAAAVQAAYTALVGRRARHRICGITAADVLLERRARGDDDEQEGRFGEHRGSLLESARLLALLDVAMADAAIACWDAKYTYVAWRPVTAIPLEASIGNAGLTVDPGDATWIPLFATPAHPEYPSGHRRLAVRLRQCSPPSLERRRISSWTMIC